VQDRFSFDDSPLTVPAGFFRLEWCYDFKHECDEGTQEAPAFLFRMSLTPKIEARVGRDVYSSNSAVSASARASDSKSTR
jgi:hypothetical protein